MATLPSTKEARNQAAIPVGAIVQPLATLDPQEAPIPIIDAGASGPIRCMRCHGYLNPFCRFVEDGYKWLCALCNGPNETPDEYFSPLGPHGSRVDVQDRPELCRGTVEYVATPTYFARPCMTPTFLLVVDVSNQAMRKGILAQVIATLSRAIHALPPRTQLGFVTFDSSLHYHVLQANEDQQLHRMHIVTDVGDPFAPASPVELLPPVGELDD